MVLRLDTFEYGGKKMQQINKLTLGITPFDSATPGPNGWLSLISRLH